MAPETWTVRLLFALGLTHFCSCIDKPTELPSYITPCYRDDPNFNNCLLQTTNLVRPYLIKGIPELNLPPISPYVVLEFKVEANDNGNNVVAFTQNSILTGLDTYNFTSFRFDVDKLLLVASFQISELSHDMQVLSNGNIEHVPLEEDLHVIHNITNSNGTIKQKLKLITINGDRYLEPEIDITKINVGTVSYVLEGLHENDPVLARAADKAINNQETYLLHQYRKVLEKKITHIIGQVLLRNLYKIPYDQLFPIRDVPGFQ